MSVLDLGASSVRKDTLVIYFHQSWSKISPALKENRSALDSILYIVRNYSHNPNFHMHVEGWASPEGAQSFNDTLARDRAESIRIWAEQHAGFRIPGNLMTVRGMGIDWTGLDSLLVEAEGLRGREEALEIVRNVPVWVYENGRIVGSRRKSLMDLNGGELYQSLMHTLFVPLRRAEIILEYEPMPQVEAVKAYISEVAALDESPMTPQVPPLEHIPLYRLALKTNLLTDAILMPSLELEWLINDEWSVAAHGAVAWWSRKPRHQYYQIASIYPEARWWFSTREPWHGHYLGLFSGGTWYDLENGGRGYKGEGGFVGLSYGYMFPVSRSISFEVGLGAGYLFTEYEEYLPVPYEGSTHYVYQQTSRMHFFGPLKFNFSFVWRFGDFGLRKDKKGGRS